MKEDWTPLRVKRMKIYLESRAGPKKRELFYSIATDRVIFSFRYGYKV